MKHIWSCTCYISLILAALLPWRGETSAETVFVPNFWDLNAPVDRPAMGVIRVIRFLTEDDYPPFDFLAPDGSITGFNIDLARALCDELKVACTIQRRRWDTLIDSLADGRGDAAIASLAMTATARRKVDFTLPYYKTPGRFVVRKSSALPDATPETLAGKVLGVESRSAHQAYLEAFFSKSTLKLYDNGPALRAALQAGIIDAAFGDGVGFAIWLNGTEAHDCCAFKGGSFTESRYFGDGVGIAVKKGNLTLREALDFALRQLAKKGTYTDLYLKYFPIGFY